MVESSFSEELVLPAPLGILETSMCHAGAQKKPINVQLFYQPTLWCVDLPRKNKTKNSTYGTAFIRPSQGLRSLAFIQTRF